MKKGDAVKWKNGRGLIVGPKDGKVMVRVYSQQDDGTWADSGDTQVLDPMEIVPASMDDDDDDDEETRTVKRGQRDKKGGTEHRVRQVVILEKRDATADHGAQVWARVNDYTLTDTYGTRFAVGGAKKYLDAHPMRPTLLFGHGMHAGIGSVLGHRVDWREDSTGLDVLFEFDDFEDVPGARQAFSQLKSGSLDSFSIGFVRNADEYVEKGDFTMITDYDLPETSIVIEASNGGTKVLQLSRSTPTEVAADVLLRYAAGDLALDDALMEVRDRLATRSDDEPRDDNGRWSSGGGDKADQAMAHITGKINAKSEDSSAHQTMAQDHLTVAQQHRTEATVQRMAGNKVAAEANDRAADAHNKAYDVHDMAKSSWDAHNAGSSPKPTGDAYAASKKAIGASYTALSLNGKREADDLEWRGGKYSAAELDALLAKGHAMKNDKGQPSYPIDNKDDFDAAVHAVGLGNKNGDTIRRYIINRANEEGWKVPDTWNTDGSLKGDERAAQLEAIKTRREHRSLITETADVLAEMRDGGGWSEDSHPRDDKGMFAAGSGGKDGSSTKAGSISNKTAAAAETLAWKVAHNPGDAEPGAEHNALGDAHMAVANAATAAGKSDIASAHTAAANAHYAAAEAWDKHDEQHGMEDTPSDASKASREGAVKLTNSAQHASEHASDVTAGFAPSQDEAKKGK